MLVPPLSYYKELATKKSTKEKNILLNNFENAETEGTEIDLENTAEAPLEVVEIAGNTTQDTREGYNLLKNELTSKNINGVTVTVYDDGSFSLDGTSTNAITLVYTSKSIKLLGDYVFYLYGKMTGINLQGVEDSSTVSYILSSNNSEYFSKNYSEETELTQVFSYIVNGTTFNNNIFKPMISKGNEVKPFQQYGSMPSLEYESEVVGVTGNTETSLKNKNQFILSDIEETTYYGVSYSCENGKIHLNGTPEKAIFIIIPLKKSIKVSKPFSWSAKTNKLISSQKKVSLWVSNNIDNSKLFSKELWFDKIYPVLSITPEKETLIDRVQFYVASNTSFDNITVETQL